MKRCDEGTVVIPLMVEDHKAHEIRVFQAIDLGIAAVCVAGGCLIGGCGFFVVAALCVGEAMGMNLAKRTLA